MGSITDYKLIICLDFDGVIHSYTSGWMGIDTIPDDPVPGAMQFIYDAVDSDFAVHIFSTRSADRLGRLAMEEWFKMHFRQWWLDANMSSGLPIDQIFKHVHFPDSKPPAFIGIDDRVLTFTGVWPSMKEIIEFRPWNKGGYLGGDEENKKK